MALDRPPHEDLAARSASPSVPPPVDQDLSSMGRLKKAADPAITALQKWSADQCSILSAGIAFYAAFSLAPTLVMVIVIAGWFFGAEAVSGQLYHELTGLMGAAAASQIQSIVAHAHRSGSNVWATCLSIVILIVGASATFSTLNTAMNIVWPRPPEPESTTKDVIVSLVKVRLISFGLVLGMAFLLIVSLILDAAVTFVGQWLWANSPWAMVGNVVQFVVSAGVLVVGFAALVKFLPEAPVRWRHAFAGGMATALLFSLGKKLFALYLVHAGMESSFGAAGSFAVLLMWLYFSAAVFLLGAEFAAVLAGHRVSRFTMMQEKMKTIRPF